MNIRHVGHGAETTVDLIIINIIATVKRQAKTKNLPLPQIYREEMVKALVENKKIKPEQIAYSIPKFKNKKKGFMLNRRQDFMLRSLTSSHISSQFSEVHLILKFVRLIAHIYQYERRINDEGDEFVDKS